MWNKVKISGFCFTMDSEIEEIILRKYKSETNETTGLWLLIKVSNWELSPEVA